MNEVFFSGNRPSCRALRRCFFAAHLTAAVLVILLLSHARPASAQPLFRPIGQPFQTPAAVANGTAILVDHYPSDQKLRLAIVLTPPHLVEERQFLEQLQDKTSPNFHKFLTGDEWAARFAPTPEAEQAVVDWAQSVGLTVTQRYPNRLIVDVEATAGTMEKAFAVTINHYNVNGQTYFSNDREPALPSSLADIIDSVQGLNSIEHARPASANGPETLHPDYTPGPVYQAGDTGQQDASPIGSLLENGTGPDALQGANVSTPPPGYYAPSDMFASTAYDYRALMAQRHCCNPLDNPKQSPPEASIAIAAYGHVNLSTDVKGFTKYFNLAWNVETFNIDGGYSCIGSGDDNCSETTLDTEWAIATSNSEGAASATAKVYVYQGGDSTSNGVLDVTTQMLNDGYARVMSTSFGCAELICWTQSSLNAQDFVYSEMAGRGWTLVAASGDQGSAAGSAAGCGTTTAVQYPASDPYVVGVGGTQLNQSNDSNYEVGWSGSFNPGSCNGNGGGSTGGFSAWWPRPSYQNGVTGSPTRAVPDVALDAFYGHYIYFSNSWGHPGGTSVAAPMVAGFFAQENAYLLSIGNKCGSGRAACAPLGTANFPIYFEATDPTAGRYPYYDMLKGCNSNDQTRAFGLTYYCAGPGYDEVTGWGSANMLQLAWAINWEVTAANGIPYVSFSGPATNKWYNRNQTVNWRIVDYNGGGSFPGTGIAGETQGWDSIPEDAHKEPHGGSGGSFYTGPQFVNDSTGCLAFEPNGCSGGVVQGCHTVHVEGWNNQGLSTGDAKYGPLCYDTVDPAVSASQTPAANHDGWNRQSVTVTLDAKDPGGSNASGIKATYYGIAPTACSTATLTECSKYSKPFIVSAQGQKVLVYFTEDNAGNFSAEHRTVSIDETAPVTTAGLSGTLSGGNWTSPVTVILKGIDNLSGVASTTYSIDGGPNVNYTGLFEISTLGSHSVSFFSRDKAGNVEATQTIQLKIVAPTTTTIASSLNPAVFGQSVTFTATVAGTFGPTPSGSVTFYDGATKLGTATLSSGAATYKTSAFLPGGHNIYASYAGDSVNLASSSSAVAETVKDTTAASVRSSLNPSLYGENVTFTATIKATHGGVATGTVTFKDGVTILGSGSVNSSTKQAIFSTSALSGGSHAITAEYDGDANNAASTSASLSQSVRAAATTTVLTSSLSPSTYGQSVTLSATLVPAHGGTVSGTVTFKDGSTSLGTAPVEADNQATFSTPLLAAGTHSLTAVYGGDGSTLPSTSTEIKQVVNKAATSTLIKSSLSPAKVGDSVTFSATVTPISGGAVTGTVTFMNGAATLGAAAVSSSTRAATLTITELPVGTNSIKAVYSGNANLDVSTSPAISEVIEN